MRTAVTEEAGWRNVKVPASRTIHVVPVEDLREHATDPGCWCRPFQADSEPRVWVHNSMDQREQYEEGRLPS